MNGAALVPRARQISHQVLPCRGITRKLQSATPRGLSGFSNISCNAGTILLFGCCRADPRERDKIKGSSQNDQIPVGPRDLIAPRSGGSRRPGLCSQSRSERGRAVGQGRPTRRPGNPLQLLNADLAGLRRILLAQPGVARRNRGSSPCHGPSIALPMTYSAQGEVQISPIHNAALRKEISEQLGVILDRKPAGMSFLLAALTRQWLGQPASSPPRLDRVVKPPTMPAAVPSGAI